MPMGIAGIAPFAKRRNNMNIIILLLTFLSIVAPAPDPECISDWVLLWETQDVNYCDTYSLYACEITKTSEYWGEYSTIKYKSLCVFDELISPQAETVFMSFLPIVTTGCPEGSWLDNGSCVILGTPVTP